MTSLPLVVENAAVRIQKVMAQAGIASRRAAEKMILEGIVSLNGQTVAELGQRMVPGRDHLVVDGKKVRLPEVGQRKVYALYKPKNSIHRYETHTSVHHISERSGRSANDR